MILSGLTRLAHDIDIRYATAVEMVGLLALAWSYCRKGEDENRPTQ